MTTITPLRCTIGQPATGDDGYFDRPYLTKQIRRALNNGSNLLISAPRRIGKSSILHHFMRRPADDEVIKYLSVQSASSGDEFFKRLFKLLIKDTEIFDGANGYMKRSSATFRSLISRFRGISFDGGLHVFQDENINYYTECQSLLEDFQDKKVIVLIDEFPDAVNNIIRGNKNLAITFLLEVRELRQTSSQLGLQFILTGSSGLANVVSQLGKNDLINDLDEIEIPPYSESESAAFIQCLVLGYQEDEADFRLDDEVVAHIINKITWRLPYYLQILVKELFEHFEEARQPVGAMEVDQVLSNMIKAKSQHYHFFGNWLSRLERSFDEPTRLAAIEILSQLASDNVSLSHDIKSLEFPEEPTQSVKQILNVLEHDGYISENQQQYGFNSFLLKQWWLEHVAE